MSEIFTTYNPAPLLENDEGIEVFMADALATGDAGHIAAALGVVAHAKGIGNLAAQTGLSREHLERSLSADGNPSLDTTLAVIQALGLVLTIAPGVRVSAVEAE